MGASFDPGDHAFVSYGPVSNDDLLQYYGFVERDNPSDAYVLEDMGKWLQEVCLLSVQTPADYRGIASMRGRFFFFGSWCVCRQPAKKVAFVADEGGLSATTCAYYPLVGLWCSFDQPNV